MKNPSRLATPCLLPICKLTREKLKLGLQRLSVISGATNFQFWGKIFGTKKDYNVVYAVDLEVQKYFPQLTFYWR